jgi:hypothetical protein
MTLSIGQLTTQPATPTPRMAGFDVPPGAEPAKDVAPIPPRVDTFEATSTPLPAQVLDDIRAARARAAELHANDRELHFTKDGACGRVVIQVRTLAGDVLKTIPPSKAIAVMSGEEL